MKKFFDRLGAELQVRPYRFLASFAILANLILICNPGYYNHDEWQRYDTVMAKGLPFFLGKYGSVRVGKSFGTPVRPIGFIEEGLTARWMPSAPALLHGIDVLLHMLLALAMLRALLICGLPRPAAVLAALIFCLSPLAMLATGWTAASFDQWYVLFALTGVMVGMRIVQQGVTGVRVLLLLLASTAAMLSKETAMAVPLALAGCAVAVALLRGEPVRWRRVLLIGTIAALPVCAYMAIRAPALLRSLALSAGPYKPGLGHVLPNLLAYLEYPFLPLLGEMVSIVLVPEPARIAALLAHLVLIALLAIEINWKAALAYLFAYLVFLLPVLSIPGAGSHYLNASALALSVALATLIVLPRRGVAGTTVRVLACLALALTMWHAVFLQTSIRRDGVCQRNFLTDLDSAMATAAAHGQTVRVVRFRPGTRSYMGSRSIFGRKQYDGIRFVMLGPATTPDPHELLMDASCHVQ